MSKRVLLSIKPEFAEKIISGEKRFEFRKRAFARTTVETIVVYATMPVGRIIGEFTIKQIISGSPATIWKKTKTSAGISHSRYQDYFEGRQSAFAIEIETVTAYEEPIDPRKSLKRFTAPQSFCYWH